MKRVKLVVAYDGTDYVGWQTQPNGTAIEEVLNRELSKLLCEQIQVIGASRTDSGVHALGNIAVFDTNARMPADKICIALNQRLPDDIVIQESCEVAPDWHPRKVNSIKTYEYRILNRKVPLPDQRFNSYFYYYDLDIEKMQKAAEYLKGEHDFKSFCSIRTQVEDTVRRIYDITLTRNGDRIDMRISGNGFLYNMVRIIAGSLIKVGCGFWPPEKIGEVLEARDRSQAGPKAPAQGLTLISIEEQKELEQKIDEDNEHWSYIVNQREIAAYGTAYIRIRRCDERDYSRLLLRLVKQVSRNGAQSICVCDQTGHLHVGYKADYFHFDGSYTIWIMEKSSESEKCDTEPIEAFELEEKDYATFCDIENETFASVPGACMRSPEMLAGNIREGERCWLIYEENKPVGIMSVTRGSDESTDYMEIEALGILPEYRNRGLGGRCIGFVEKLAKTEGCSKIRLICADSNPAERLYRRFGFTEKESLSEWFVTRDEKRNAALCGQKND